MKNKQIFIILSLIAVSSAMLTGIVLFIKYVYEAQQTLNSDLPTIFTILSLAVLFILNIRTIVNMFEMIAEAMNSDEGNTGIKLRKPLLLVLVSVITCLLSLAFAYIKGYLSI